jgi:predicted dehydrogenase
MEFWKVDKGFANLSEAINSGIELDVVSICSPTDQYEIDILLAIILTSKIIFCEKPIASSLNSSKTVALACNNQ